MDAGSTIDLIQESEYPDKLSTQDHIFVTRASESWVGPREKNVYPFPQWPVPPPPRARSPAAAAPLAFGAQRERHLAWGAFSMPGR